MQRKMIYAALFAVMTTLTVAIPRASAFSDWIAVYAIVDKVVIEPTEGGAERIQIWGDFAFALENDRNYYQKPQRGYLYYTLKPGKEDISRNEWNDLKAIAGTGQIIGFGARNLPSGRVRKAEDKPNSPDVYPASYGLVKMNQRSSTYPPFVELKALPRPARSK